MEWLAVIAGAIGLATAVFNYFKKTPAEKERSRIEDEKEERSEDAMDRAKAMKRAKGGDTRDLEKLLND
jgi:hypothetical protein